MATNRTGRWGSSTRSPTGSSGKRFVSGYQTVCNSFNKKIASYKCLTTQATGPAKCARPTPATLNSFGKWIEKGAIIQKVSSAQVKRWASTNRTFKSATSAKTVLQQRFGKGCIKAVACDKAGGFLVATPAIWKGRAFSFPR
ncbi:MAG: hypothetical protein V3W34_07900 [Phycisphaerae bacterium]